MRVRATRKGILMLIKLLYVYILLFATPSCYLIYCTFLMSALFSILTWNVRGIISSSISLSQILNNTNCDVAIICEHKLKPTSIQYLDSINSRYSSYVHIDTDYSQNNSVKPYLRFVGKGGVEIMCSLHCQKYQISILLV